MKLEETVMLNGQEYTLELNRDTALKIDQYSNINKSFKKINESGYEYKDELTIMENENPFEEIIDDEELERIANEKESILKKVISKAFWLWLYPKHKLNYIEVEKIINKNFENEKDAENISKLYGKYLDMSMNIREKHLEERKKLKAISK